MKYFFTSLIVLFSAMNAMAQLQFSDSLRISLLTVDDGEDAYECFGHTGLRVTDLKTDADIVFHYGVYNYTEPNFIWHFVEGKCNYSMGAMHASSFFESHRRRQLNIIEQTLHLDSAQSVGLVDALVENYAPQNRHYRYNFFFDNCATRPFDMLNKWADIQYDTTWIQKITLRDMIHEKTGIGNWLDFGIAVAVAGRSDQQTTFREQMFLPSYLSNAVSHAYNNGEPLVSNEILHPYSVPSKHAENTPFSPIAVALVLMLTALVISVLQIQKKGGNKTLIASQTFDTIWLFVTGIAGCIIWFLNFFSEHPAVDNNLNCLWLLPTNVLFTVIIWIKKANFVCRIYFFIIFAAEIIYIISVCSSAQYVHLAFLPILTLIGIRAIARIKQ